MPINREKFYDSIRDSLFDGHISVEQFKGIDAILNEYENNYADSLPASALAYIFATPHHETDKRFAGIEEYDRGAGRAYGKRDPVTKQKYYGRGLVQLTWKYNYESASKKFGIDFVNHPEKALELDNSVKILFWGMTQGKFTGAKLSRYFSKTKEPTYNDFYRARAIINGTDKANKIASYAENFYAALQKSLS